MGFTNMQSPYGERRTAQPPVESSATTPRLRNVGGAARRRTSWAPQVVRQVIPDLHVHASPGGRLGANTAHGPTEVCRERVQLRQTALCPGAATAETDRSAKALRFKGESG